MSKLIVEQKWHVFMSHRVVLSSTQMWFMHNMYAKADRLSDWWNVLCSKLNLL